MSAHISRQILLKKLNSKTYIQHTRHNNIAALEDLCYRSPFVKEWGQTPIHKDKEERQAALSQGEHLKYQVSVLVCNLGSQSVL